MSANLIDEVLYCPNLPSLPAVAMEVLELTSDANVPIKKIAGVVQRDQALAAKVLKTVNSSFYGLSKRCASIDRAMTYLGMNTVKSLVLGFSLVDVAKVTEGTDFDLMGHWRRALLGATASRAIADQTRCGDPYEAFTAGLFQDIGVLACFAALGERYTSVVSGAVHSKWESLEKAALGFTHVEVGGQLAAKWKLPESVIAGVSGHHAPDKVEGPERDLARTVAMGAAVAEVLGEPLPPGAVRKITKMGHEWFGERAPNAKGLLEAVTEDAKTLAKMFDQDMGSLQDTGRLLAEASERNLEHQITVQRENETFAKEATTDGLTGLANRKKFDATLEAAARRFRETGEDCTVIFTDADRFKSVNDTYGHSAGDAVLMGLARRISECVGDGGLVCRYGGEEIAIILPETGIDLAAVTGEAIRACIDDEPFDLTHIETAPDELHVTVSVGVASTDGDSKERYQDFKNLLSDADSCVYDAKSAGRNRVFVHRPKADAPAATASSVAAAPGVLRIMLVEDDPLAATLITTLLKRKQNVEVQWIESGSRARTELMNIDQGKCPAVDVFLVDLNLPGTNGFELLAIVRESSVMKGLPFFVLSGEEEGPSRLESKRLGATDFIPKQQFVQEIGQWINVIMHAKERAHAA